MWLGRSIRWFGIAVLAGLVAADRPAAAQSQRYPQPLADKDRENEETSSLWERTVEPGRAPHATLLGEARRLLAVGRTDAELAQAAAKASQAIALRPKDAAAYLVRAVATEQLRQWSDCASSYQTALELDPKLGPDPELRTSGSPLLGLGICLARAGKLAQAELAFDRAVSRAPIGIEEWLRLGEVRIALGKLREGIDALTASTEATGESMPTALNNWLRALAYDRGRQTALADEAGAAAALADRYLGQLNNQGTPFIHDVERSSLLALGYQYTGRLEVSLAYHRRIAAAPDGIWTRRAREHIELLEQAAFPEELRRAGPAPVDIQVARALVRKAMPALAACVTAVPSVAFDVRVTRSRPALPGTGPRAVPRPPGASATSAMIDQPTLEPIERAQACLQDVALRLELPPVKDPGTWYELAFSVVAQRSRP
jgi:tetratricopeptide (TPR) repeat protein